jgi:hypothetical protein
MCDRHSSAVRVAARGVALLSAALLFTGASERASACACGCGVFEVGTASMFPNAAGGMVYLDYNYMNQDQNWSGTSKAPAENNEDKKLESNFVTAGVDYLFNRSWGVSLKVPYWHRSFTTIDEPSGELATFHHGALGDIRMLGNYSGFSEDMSTGLLFGVKLATGDYTYPGFDRDTAIGTGSTDLLLGIYHRDGLTSTNSWSYYVQALWDRPVVTRGGYNPGAEGDFAIGAFYNVGFPVGPARVSPVLQLVVSLRGRDSGPESNPEGSGYTRALISPGIEVNWGGTHVYADIEIPVYQNIVGNQLVAMRQYKLVVSTHF